MVILIARAPPSGKHCSSLQKGNPILRFTEEACMTEEKKAVLFRVNY